MASPNLLIFEAAPLRNTLRRAMDQLYLETGDALFRIIPRKRSKAKSAKPANLVQNSLAESREKASN
jgi:hypothetical protein